MIPNSSAEQLLVDDFVNAIVAQVDDDIMRSLCVDYKLGEHMDRENPWDRYYIPTGTVIGTRIVQPLSQDLSVATFLVMTSTKVAVYDQNDIWFKPGMYSLDSWAHDTDPRSYWGFYLPQNELKISCIVVQKDRVQII